MSAGFFFSNKYQLTIRHLTFHRREAHRKGVRHGQGRGHGKDAKAEANLSLSPLSSQRGAEERRVARTRGGVTARTRRRRQMGSLRRSERNRRGGDDGSSSGNDCII